MQKIARPISCRPEEKLNPTGGRGIKACKAAKTGGLKPFASSVLCGSIQPKQGGDHVSIQPLPSLEFPSVRLIRCCTIPFQAAPEPYE